MTKTLRTAAAASATCGAHVRDALVALAEFRAVGVNPAGILANPEGQLLPALLGFAMFTQDRGL